VRLTPLATPINLPKLSPPCLRSDFKKKLHYYFPICHKILFSFLMPSTFIYIIHFIDICVVQLNYDNTHHTFPHFFGTESQENLWIELMKFIGYKNCLLAVVRRFLCYSIRKNNKILSVLCCCIISNISNIFSDVTHIFIFFFSFFFVKIHVDDRASYFQLCSITLYIRLAWKIKHRSELERNEERF